MFQQRWRADKANHWYRQQPCLIGSNYIPATAINQLEMWQADSFDPQQIDKEFGWAEAAGMNTMRVFLHDLLWQQDAEGFKKRIDSFLGIAARHGIKPMFVLFDSCWNPSPRLGTQPVPKPGVHNSGWVQSPGIAALKDPAQYPRMEAYVKGIVGAFANDQRVLAWDVWNEPDNPNSVSYAKADSGKYDYVLALLPKAFEWARSAHPQQPLTSGVWNGDWSAEKTLAPMEKIQLHSSDVISFHNYGESQDFEKRITDLQRYHRPLLCTEYMARGNKSTFQATLPSAIKHQVAAYNWGLVRGKTQTHMPWDSWEKPYNDCDPPVWFHDVFHPDGKPYLAEETAFLQRVRTELASAPRQTDARYGFKSQLHADSAAKPGSREGLQR